MICAGLSKFINFKGNFKTSITKKNIFQTPKIFSVENLLY